MTAQAATNVLWVVFYATWIAAVIWSGKTKTQMRTDMGGLHRGLSALGVILLFAPLGRLAEGRPFLQVVFGRLWPASSAADWSLMGLTIAGFAFCWWARLHLGRLWSGFATLKEDHRIVDTGPYGLV
ncbi:MAG TPA: hypothetical protein VFH92_10695, partial [Phenylobacterium sp.]|nr:hypothetical protein [Phenylobacterium sp.]